MDLAARTNALHDLLPQVAAFAEMQCVRLIGFLGQKPLADIFAVAGLAMFQADHASRFGVGRLGAGGFQTRDQRGLFRDRRKNEEPGAAGGVKPRDQRIRPNPGSSIPPRESAQPARSSNVGRFAGLPPRWSR